LPLFWLSLALIGGVVLGSAARLPGWAWAVLIAISFGAAVFEARHFRGRPRQGLRKHLPLPVGVLLAALFIGALRWQAAVPVFDPADLAYYNDGAEIEITGWVESYPDRREAAVQLRIRAESVQFDDGTRQSVRGKVLVRLSPGADFAYGDRLEVWGSLLTPPEDEDFSYKDYLARQGVYSYMMYPAARWIGKDGGSPLMAGIYRLREHAYRTINRIFPQPEAALLSGVLLGLERDLPESTETAFQDTGTAHIVAISGFNMTILAALLIGLFGRFLPRGWSVLAAAAGIIFYTLLVGANPAVVRAAIMGSLALFGRLIGRGSSGLTPLAFSAGLMCLVNPLLPWDASFQLSFTATLGLILYGEPLQRTFESWAAERWGEERAKHLAGPVSEYFLFTLAAQVTTLPVVLMQFGRLSLTSMLANPLILPVQPGVMILGGLALIAGMLLPILGQALAWLAWPLAAYTLRVVEGVAGIRGGAVTVSAFTPWMALVSYAALFALTLGRGRLAELRKKLRPGLIFAGLGLVVLVAWSAALRRPDGHLHLILLDAPETQAVLLRTPGGQSVLIGSGSAGNELAGGVGRVLGPFDRRLDGLVLISDSSSQLDGLPPLIERFRVGLAFWAVPAPEKRAAERVNQALQEGGTRVYPLEAGAEVQLDGGVMLRVLSEREGQAALQIEHGNLCILWPGESTPQALQRSGQRFDGCLLLADPKFNPEVWGNRNPLGTISFGASPGALSTGANGQIELTSDGDKLWIEVERP